MALMRCDMLGVQQSGFVFGRIN